MLKAEIAEKLSWIPKTLLFNDGYLLIQGPRSSSFNGFDQRYSQKKYSMEEEASVWGSGWTYDCTGSKARRN